MQTNRKHAPTMVRFFLEWDIESKRDKEKIERERETQRGRQTVQHTEEQCTQIANTPRQWSDFMYQMQPPICILTVSMPDCLGKRKATQRNIDTEIVCV